jgi:hypothetical protein
MRNELMLKELVEQGSRGLPAAPSQLAHLSSASASVGVGILRVLAGDRY